MIPGRAEPSNKIAELKGLARASETGVSMPRFRTKRVIATALIVSSLTIPAELLIVNAARENPAQKATVSKSYPYITESGVSFGQKETSLAVTVKAVPQNIPGGGVAMYQLNGYTNGGSWYQESVCYFDNYDGLRGFYFLTEVFNPSAVQVYPASHPGAEFFPPVGFPMLINAGDKILLTMNIANGLVTADARDLNNGLSSGVVGETESSYFSGSALINKHGFFTGDMTEIHQSKSNNVNGFNRVNYNITGADSPGFVSRVWVEVGISATITAQKPTAIIWEGASGRRASTSLDGISATYSKGTFTSSSSK